MRGWWNRGVPMITAAALVWATTSCPATELVRDGRPCGAIQHLEGEPQEIAEAAAELTLYLKKISGAEVPVHVLQPGAAAGPGILLGTLAEEAGLRVAVQTVSKEAFRIRMAGDKLLLVGESPVAVRHAAYKLLETLGVRWFMPGELGEVVPHSGSVRGADTDLTDQPDAPYRRFWFGGKLTAGEVLQWNKRNRNAGYRGGSFRHAWGHLVPAELLQSKPEYFSLSRGQRTTRQLCTTHPDVAGVAAGTLAADMAASPDWIFPAGPNDGGGLCECASCRALDTPDYLEPSSGLPNCSDRILDFANRIAALTAKEYPDRLISFLVYSEYSRVPHQVAQIHPNVMPMFAPIRRCRLHGPDHPLCPPNQLFGQEIRGWAKMSRQLGFYPYNYNLADALLPLSKVPAYKAYQKLIREVKPATLAWDFETLDAWSIYAPHLYLSARLMWDIDLDIDAAMEVFYARFYGPAAGPMRAYWQTLERAYDQTPAHAGSFFDLHLAFTPERMAALGNHLAAAQQAASAEPFTSRVAMAAAGFQCARHFLAIRERMNACRFVEAKQEQARLFAHLEAMAQHKDPEWTHLRYSKGYFETFLGRTIEGGAAALSDGGRLVLALPDQWRFAKDERDEGTAQQWFAENYDDAAWQTLKTYSASWEEQGLGWYKRRPAWYRVWIDVPADERGRDLRLWFGGIDESAEVYLNGRKLGESRGFACPFEFPVSDALRFGQKNLIAVRCLSLGLQELGTGGILRPLMLYVPGQPSKPAAAPKGESYLK